MRLSKMIPLGLLGGGGLLTYAITQSQNTELLIDGGFETGIASWVGLFTPTLSNPAGTRSGGSGTKVMRIAYNASNNPGAYQTPTVAIGEVHRVTGWVQGDGTKVPRVDFTSGSAIQTMLATASWQPFDLLYVADSTNFSSILRILATSAGFVEFDDMSEKKLSINSQITAPSANMRISQYYTLTASPVVGSQIWVMPRVSGFGGALVNHNYWLALLTYNTSNQWDINLYSVAAGVRTSRTSATNIGTTNGIRINCNGDLLDLQTTADGGANWTTRGSQVNNSLYNTATGANAIYSPNNTIGLMTYEAAV